MEHLSSLSTSLLDTSPSNSLASWEKEPILYSNPVQILYLFIYIYMNIYIYMQILIGRASCSGPKLSMIIRDKYRPQILKLYVGNHLK